MTPTFRVFLDDERQMPSGFDLHLSAAEDAIELIKAGKVKYISLDNDLGEQKTEGKAVAQYIESAFLQNEIGFIDFEPHTSNSAARQEIIRCKENIFRYIQSQLEIGNEAPFQKMARHYAGLVEATILQMQKKPVHNVTFTELFELGLSALKQCVLTSPTERTFTAHFAWWVWQTILKR